MYSASKFEFTTVAPGHADVTIDRSTQGKQALLLRLAEGLSFPDYFGKSWDALIDCLSDLSWMQTPEVIIDHVGVPRLSEMDVRLYLESLIDAAERRTPDRVPKVRILFRIEDRDIVEGALTDS